MKRDERLVRLSREHTQALMLALRIERDVPGGPEVQLAALYSRERATARPVCDALLEAMRRHGVPEGILSDNGKVFTGRFGPHKGEVLFDRICREHGIRRWRA